MNPKNKDERLPEFTPEVMLGFRAMACGLSARLAEHPAARSACEWLQLVVDRQRDLPTYTPIGVTAEVVSGFRAMARALTVLHAEPPAVRAACEWLTLDLSRTALDNDHTRQQLRDEMKQLTPAQ